MIKKNLFILGLLFSLTVGAQEKLAEFTTTHYSAIASANSGVSQYLNGNPQKLSYMFTLYNDSLVMEMKNVSKLVKKMLEKQGDSTKKTIVGLFEQVDQDIWEYRTETIRYQVIPQQKEGVFSVKLQTKDDFTGANTTTLFFNVK